MNITSLENTNLNTKAPFIDVKQSKTRKVHKESLKPSEFHLNSLKLIDKNILIQKQQFKGVSKVKRGTGKKSSASNIADKKMSCKRE